MIVSEKAEEKRKNSFEILFLFLKAFESASKYYTLPYYYYYFYIIIIIIIIRITIFCLPYFITSLRTSG